MSIDEFKAWFDGFTTGKDGLTAADLETVKNKLASVPFPRAGVLHRVPPVCG